MKNAYWLTAIPAALCLLAGCSSGGDSVSTGGGVQRANVTGQVQSPASGSLSTTLVAMVAGTAISAPVQASGDFSLNGVTVGTETIIIVEANDATQTPLSSETVSLKAGANTIPPLAPPGNFTPAASSGISGVVMEGPIAPVARPGVPNSRPYAGATLVITTNGNAQATTIVSKADGTFSVQLAPGVYTITPQPGQNGFPHGNPMQVTVKANETTNVEVDYDTGIR